MFISYGRLTWVNTPLDPNMEEMKLPRANRTIIADSILADLDKAVMYLNTQNNSATMRIHKDVARALKSEVALFEGTWEKYHKAKNDKFFDSTVTDEKIRDYFNQAVAAAKEVMDRAYGPFIILVTNWMIIVRCFRLQIYRVIRKYFGINSMMEIRLVIM